MSNLIILSDEFSKVKTIEYCLGTQYGFSYQYIRFGFIPIPESVKNGMDFLLHSTSSSLEGRVALAAPTSSSEIPEGANLFEEAEKRQKELSHRASFVSCAEAERVSQVISEHLETEVKIAKQRNPQLALIAQQAQMDAQSKAFGKKFANAISTAISLAFGETLSHEESSDSEVSDVKPASSSSAPVELTEDEKYIVRHLEIRTIELFAKVVGILSCEGWISQADARAISCCPLAKKIEEYAAFRQNLSPSLSADQFHALRNFFEFYVTPIIDQCTELDTPEKVLGHASSRRKLSLPLVPRDVAFAALVHCASKSYSTLMLEQFAGLKDLTECGQMLANIFTGTTQMECLLKEQGIAIPSLEVQRTVLFECFEEKLNERFGPEDLSKIPAEFNSALVKELRKQLFVDGYFLNMIERIDFSQTPIVFRPDGSCGFASIPPMTINTFSGTIMPLQGKFLVSNWSPNRAGFLDAETAAQRFASLKQKALERLNVSSPAASSI